MSDIDALLSQVESLIISVKPAEAEERLRSLVTTMGTAELRAWEPELRLVLSKFLPKRRRALTELLDASLKGQGLSQRLAEPDVELSAEMTAMVKKLGDDLAYLYNHHIFQWGTFYRDYLEPYYTLFMEASDDPSIWLAVESARQLVSKHAKEIYLKGYLYVTDHDSEQRAIAKSVSGLQRFLDLPIELYSARLFADLRHAEAICLRRLTSAMLCGIVEGYSQVPFGELPGRDLLGAHIGSWAHVLPFMVTSHIQSVLVLLEADQASASLSSSALPLAETLDKLADDATSGYVPLPALAQLSWPQRRINVSLRPPQYSPDRRPVEIQCYFDPAFVDTDLLDEAIQRDVSAIVTPLRPDLRAFVSNEGRVQHVIVPVLEDATIRDAREASERLTSILNEAIYRHRSTRVGAQPLQYNFAREFPLSNALPPAHYHVYRPSVRDLLRTFERRNGVRLWCSVRRSGKTTAGIDLGTTSGKSNVITQTCDDAGQIEDGFVFYERICEALADGGQLPRDFLRDTVHRCMSGGQTPEQRTVFVIDEYETLFGRLAADAEDHKRLRYTVVQPLLNQFVAFSAENLIVFLGQQPTAHSIFMEQNQLSAYVQQDPFPLFHHEVGSDDSEFSALLGKIMGDRRNVRFDPSFTDRVFVETAGHPYLTVNLLIDFFDWLIKNKRPVNALSFSAADVSRFAQQMFRRDRLAVSPEYHYFRDEVIRPALSAKSRRNNPWLYAVYNVIRAIAFDNPDTFVCSRADFADIVDRLGLHEVGITPEYLLTTGSRANFLTFSTQAVAPRIRLLGRLAAVASPAVEP